VLAVETSDAYRSGRSQTAPAPRPRAAANVATYSTSVTPACWCAATAAGCPSNHSKVRSTNFRGRPVRFRA
jgi:hypothetical protein